MDAKAQNSKIEDSNTRAEIELLYRRFAGKTLASLILILGDFDRAEEALQEAFLQALESWPQEGLPDNPGAWLVSAGRFRAIDKLRRRARFDAVLAQIADELEQAQVSSPLSTTAYCYRRSQPCGSRCHVPRRERGTALA